MRSLLSILMVMSSISLTGCLMTREQIREGANSSNGGKSDISQMQVKRAEEVARVDELEETVRLLRGEIEVAQNQIRRMEEAKAAETNSQAGNAVSSEQLQKKLTLFEEALRAMETRLNQLGQEVQRLKARPSAKAAPARKESMGNYGGAQEAFDRKSWKQAIVGYEKYRELNPRGRRYPDATYKIGVCFQELGMRSEAKAFYQEVIAKFPKSSTAKKAKYRLSQVK